MNNLFIEQIYTKNQRMMTREKLLNVYHLLSQTLALQLQGACVECGCFRGYTGVLMQMTMERAQEVRELHLFDSFEGLPEKQEEDLCRFPKEMQTEDRKDNQRIKKGWFKAGVEEVMKAFEAFEADKPTVHVGWFSDTIPRQLPDQICFAHLDGDFFTSTQESLEGIYPRLTTGAIVIIDDYCDPKWHGRQNALPGVKRACDMVMADKIERVEPLLAGKGFQGWFRKK
jgi:O-methyltransferase